MIRHNLMATCALVALAANNDAGGKSVPGGFKGLGKATTEGTKPGEPLPSSSTPDADGKVEGVESANTSETEKAQSPEAPLEPEAAKHNGDLEEAQQLEATQLAAEQAVPAVAPIHKTLDTEVIPPRVGVEGTLANAGVDTVTFHGEAAEQAVEAQQDALQSDGLENDGSVLYSSHPIAKLGLGDFQFENSQLRVEADKVAEFDKLVAAQPPQIRNAIRKIDVGAANSLISNLRQSRMTSGVDTSANSFGPSPTQKA